MHDSFLEIYERGVLGANDLMISFGDDLSLEGYIEAESHIESENANLKDSIETFPGVVLLLPSIQLSCQTLDGS